MAMHQSRSGEPVERAYDTTHDTAIARRAVFDRIPWRGVFAGSVVAIALQTLLMLIGVGVGLVAVDAPSNMGGVAIATGIWWVISGVASVFVGAWVAGRLTVPRDALDGAITGAVTWSLLTVASLWLATASAGAVIGGAYAATAGAAQAALSGGSETNVIVRNGSEQQRDGENRPGYVDLGAGGNGLDPQINWGAIGSDVEKFLNSAGIRTSGIDMSEEFESFGDAPVVNTREFYGRVRTFLERGRDVDREAIVDYLSENTEMSEAEIDQALDKWEERYRELRADAERLAREAKQFGRDATEATSDFVGEAALWTAFMLVLGLGAGCAGGAVGVRAAPVTVRDRADTTRTTA